MYEKARETIRSDREQNLYSAVTLDMRIREKLYATGIKLPRILNDTAFLGCLGPSYADSFLEQLYWLHVFVGSPNSGMQLHHDDLDTHVWGIQLSGSKSFVFCDPAAGKDERGGIYTQSEIEQKSPVDGFAVDHGRFPDAVTDARCFHATARPGDLVYWPSRWWHQSKNNDGDVLSIALSGMHVNKRKLGDFLHKIQGHWGIRGAFHGRVETCLRHGV